MYSEQAFREIIASAYDAAGDPLLWPSFLDLFARTIGAASANLSLQDLRSHSGNVQAITNVDPAFLQKYNEYYGKLDCWAIGGARLLTTGAVLTDQMMCATPHLVRSEFYNDFLRPQNHYHDLCGVIFHEEKRVCVVSLQRSAEAGAFDADEIRILNAVLPHLQRAFQLHRRIADLEIRSQGADILNRLPIACLLLASSGRVLFLNESARRIVSENDGLFLSRDSLDVHRRDESRELEGLIRSAALTSSGAGLGSGGVMTVSRRSLKRPFTVLVSPSPAQNPGMVFTQETGTIIVFITDPELESEPEETALRRLFGLTGAEAKLAAFLARGRSLEDAKDRLGVSRNTLRTHLQRIYAKTGTRRQGELVRLILSTPSGLGAR